jgi:magnesium and cobalt transporter
MAEALYFILHGAVQPKYIYMSSDDSYPHSKNNHHRPENWINRIGHIIKGDPADKEDLAEIITDAGEREIIDEDTEDMLKGVFEISELRVRDIMIPRSQMVTISAEYSIDRAASEIIKSGHSRYPVIHEDKDHIEGILLAKDLLKFVVNQDKNAKLTDIIRPAVVVPESKHVDRLLKEFQQCRYHMAIVVDEYGGVSGLVTIEDILELIVGEIEDEYDNDDDEQDEIVQVNDNTYHIASLTSIENFNRKFNTSYTDDEYDTIGGMVMHAIGHLPVKGETVHIDNFEFKILSTVRHSTSLLQLTIHPEEEI